MPSAAFTATDGAGNVIDLSANLVGSGTVTGFTASTITVDGTNYRLLTNTAVIKVNADFTTTALTVSSVVNTAVSFYAVNGDMILVIAP